MRSPKGIQLLEMVVAVGLSGVFVVLLSGMLAQTLALSTASQNQIIAGAIADQLVEEIQSGVWSGTSLDFNFKTDSATPTTAPYLGLDVDNLSFGTFNQGERWQLGTGNQFTGTASVRQTSLGNANTYEVKVEYPSGSGGTRTLTRVAVAQWQNGATF